MINERILIGSQESPSYTFDENSIESITCENSIGLTGGDMSADVLEVGVFFNDLTEQFANLAYSTPIFYYSNGRSVGKYYVLSVEQKGINRYLIRATSLIGIIEREKFYGGMYNGERFDRTVFQALTSDGVSPELEIFEAQNNSNMTYSQKVGDIADSLDQYKYRLHVNFTIVSTYSQPSAGSYETSEIAGERSLYSVSLRGYKDSSSEQMYYEVRISYGPVTPSGQRQNFNNIFGSTKLVGDGSTIDVDINPLSGKLKVTANYIKPGEPSVTGVLTYEDTVTLPATTSGSEKVNLYFALGASVRSYSSTVGGYISTSNNYKYFALKWNAYEVYNESGGKEVDAFYAKKDSVNYIGNAANGYLAIASNIRTWDTVGNSIGFLSRGSLDKYSRLLELNSSVSFNEDVAALPVFGWIPAGTRREALHQILFSQGINMIRSADGEILFTALSDSVSGEILDDNLYSNGSEERLQQAKTIAVTEHTFSPPSGDPEVLFDNSQATLIDGEYIAYFRNAPVYGTPTVSGTIRIVNYNCNAAVVTGRGIITGTPYVHSENVISYTNGNVSDGADVSVADATLISSLNSDNVMNRLKAYYCADVRKTDVGIRFNGERCGAVYSFTSPLLQRVSAFLTRYTSRSSSFVKSDCEFIRGYVPQKSGGYTSFAIVPYGSTFTVPEEVKQQASPTIRLNIIGTGGNGSYGGNGSEGDYAEAVSSWPSGSAKGGAGGIGGNGGVGGKILTVSVDVSNVDTVSVEQSGNNTVVKTYNGSTLVNTYSSASGNSQDAGFVNAFTGVAYALPGNKGIDGGAGGEGGWVRSGGQMVMGTNGEDVGIYHGGLTLQGLDYWEYYTWYTVGGGGGASATDDGRDAYQNFNYQYTYGGDGADGGDPTETTPVYGCGGNGGNGGGGGGGAGVTVVQYGEGGIVETNSQTPGRGGEGGPGGVGYPGCLIIYY